MLRSLAFVLVLGLSAQLAVAADEPPLDPNVKGVMAQARSLAPKVAAVLMNQQQGMPGCATLTVKKAYLATLMGPVVFNPDGSVHNGQWLVRYAVDACGQQGFRNVAFTTTDKGIAIDALAPGETLADPRLQKDVVKSFRMAAARAVDDCKDAAVVKATDVLGYPQRPDKPWREVWIGTLCGREVGQVVEFLPGPKGTTFKMALEKAPSATVIIPAAGKR